MGLRESILAQERRTKEVTLPDIGCIVVRELSVAEVQAIAERYDLLTKAGAVGALPDFTIAACLDPQSKLPLFTLVDRDALAALPPRVLEPVSEAIGELSKLKKSVDEEAKNSEATVSGDISST